MFNPLRRALPIFLMLAAFLTPGFTLEGPRFTDLPKNLAIMRSEGNGKRVFALFEDPFCPACKYFETQLDSLTDYTVYIYTYPILGRRSVETSTAVWCSADPLANWEKSVRTRTALPLNKSCLETVGRILELGERLGITATPSLILENDTAVKGAVPAKYLSGLLDKASRTSSASRQATVSGQAVASTNGPMGPKLIEIPGGDATFTARPKLPAVFVFTNGERIESPDYMITKDDLIIEADGQKRRYAIKSLDKAGTKAANIERGIVINFPISRSEVNLNF